MNMHMAVLGNVARRWRMAGPGSATVRRASAFGETLTEVTSTRARSSRPPSASPDRTSRVPSRPPRARSAAGCVDGEKNLLHDVAGGDRAVHDRLRSSTTRARERYGYLHIPARAPGVGDPRRLGRPRHARLREPLGHVRPGRAARVRGIARRVRGRQPRGVPGVEPHGRAVPRLRRRWGSPSAYEIATRPLADRRPGRAVADARGPRGAIGLGAARASLARAAPLLGEAHLDAGEGAVEEVFAEIQGGEDVHQRDGRTRRLTARSR